MYILITTMFGSIEPRDVLALQPWFIRSLGLCGFRHCNKIDLIQRGFDNIIGNIYYLPIL